METENHHLANTTVITAAGKIQRCLLKFMDGSTMRTRIFAVSMFLPTSTFTVKSNLEDTVKHVIKVNITRNETQQYDEPPEMML